eukprot:3479615-Rhodomonas_salina.8
MGILSRLGMTCFSDRSCNGQPPSPQRKFSASASSESSASSKPGKYHAKKPQSLKIKVAR